MLEDKERRISDSLRDKYRPLAILLHGSRAVYKSRPRSSWDVFLLFAEPPKPAAGREAIAGEDVEWKALPAEVPDAKLMDTFGVMLQFARLWWEQDDAGTRLLAQAARVYEKGMRIPEENLPMYKLYLTHKVWGMEDDIGTPYMFLRHVSEFFLRAVDWWFIFRGDLKKPFYIAVPHIKTADPEYYALLMTMCGEGGNQEKIRAGYELVARLFAVVGLPGVATLPRPSP